MGRATGAHLRGVPSSPVPVAARKCASSPSSSKRLPCNASSITSASPAPRQASRPAEGRRSGRRRSSRCSLTRESNPSPSIRSTRPSVGNAPHLVSVAPVVDRGGLIWTAGSQPPDRRFLADSSAMFPPSCLCGPPEGAHLGLTAVGDGLALALCRAYTAQKAGIGIPILRWHLLDQMLPSSRVCSG